LVIGSSSILKTMKKVWESVKYNNKHLKM